VGILLVRPHKVIHKVIQPPGLATGDIPGYGHWGLVHFRTLVILRRVRVRVRLGLELSLGLELMLGLG